MTSLLQEERAHLRARLLPGEGIEIVVPGMTRLSNQVWVLTTRRLLMLDRAAWAVHLAELPRRAITAVELERLSSGTALRCWSARQRYDLLGAEPLAAGRFAARVGGHRPAAGRIDNRRAGA